MKKKAAFAALIYIHIKANEVFIIMGLHDSNLLYITFMNIHPQQLRNGSNIFKMIFILH
jgi:hypothetical protein